MSKHNYTKYANQNNNAVATEVVSTVAPVEPTLEPVIEPSVLTTTCEHCGLSYDPSETHECVAQSNCGAVTKGAVVNCVKLNVREKPNTDADVLCALDVKSEVNIDVDESTSEWFKVYTTAGIEGYCMKKFINTNL